MAGQDESDRPVSKALREELIRRLGEEGYRDLLAAKQRGDFDAFREIGQRGRTRPADAARDEVKPLDSDPPQA